MRILAMAHAYPPHHNAGGEMTLHSMLRHLAARGHDVHVQLSEQASGPAEDYTFDGVQVHRYLDNGSVMPYFTDKARRAGVVIAHLENTRRAGALCEMHRVPLVHLVHNDLDWTRNRLRRGPCALAVFNTHWMHEAYEAWWARTVAAPMPRSIVVHPPVIPEDYRTKNGQSVTLINLSEAKGGELFWRLAKALPSKQFVGVHGAYGEQVVPPGYEHGDVPNVTLFRHLKPSEMATDIYSRTKVLLMPSSYETYGRTAIEAAYCGIPTIAHPTPGLVEALGSAGTFVDRDDLDGWVAAIRYLSSPRGFSAASKRAKTHAEALAPTADLDRFADAMEGVVARGFATAAR